MFRSGMREATESSLVLKGIPVPVFELVLKAIYSGLDVLTLENFIDVWQAVHQLQIDFMIKSCQHFAIQSISINMWEEIYRNAKLLNSKCVSDEVNSFLLKNFDAVCIAPTFLEFPYHELCELLQSQELVVTREDLVLSSVMRWVEGGSQLNQCKETSVEEGEEKEIESEEKLSLRVQDSTDQTVGQADQTAGDRLSRQDKLTALLSLVRMCLVSPRALTRVLKLRLISENRDAREIIVNAFSYHVLDYRHGQWSSSAIQRLCSGYTHFGVKARSNGTFDFLGADNEKWHTCSTSDYLQRDVKIVNFDNELYAIGMQNANYPNGPCQMLVLCENTWAIVLQMPSKDLLLVSHGHFIYIINKSNKTIYCVKPKLKTPRLLKYIDCPETVANVSHAMAIENFLLVFCSITHNEVDETAVHMLDISTKVWSRLDNLEGPAEHLVSFRDDKNSYILQTSGSLWKLVVSACYQRVEFKCIAQLWNFKKRLNGALTYGGKLLIHGNDPSKDPADQPKLKKVPEYFKTIVYRGTEDMCSNFIPITLPNRAVLPDG
ncbi:uncharacterized protein LOC131958301 [Physella acuta]|uniref:uncharacterized protein LOC131958301 n=1 Tax=Physella acuta TaxID=109671 RepID=UPI0027DBB398|nr:uncharacterized protein LOC131958301 [Physella acuta]